MTADAFRRLALSMPEATEVGHLGHPDFRVAGRIFATLGYPDASCGMVKLKPEQQEALIHAEPEVFTPAAGKWGLAGATVVRLRKASTKSVRVALTAAWRNLAPRKLVETIDRPA